MITYSNTTLWKVNKKRLFDVCDPFAEGIEMVTIEDAMITSTMKWWEQVKVSKEYLPVKLPSTWMI